MDQEQDTCEPLRLREHIRQIQQGELFQNCPLIHQLLNTPNAADASNMLGRNLSRAGSPLEIPNLHVPFLP